MLLADPGEARGCSINRLVTDSLIQSVSQPFPPTALRCRNAQTVRDRSSVYKMNYKDQELFKSRRISKSHQWLNSYAHFTEGVDFAYLWSFSGDGAAPAACAAGLYFSYHESKLEEKLCSHVKKNIGKNGIHYSVPQGHS